MLKIVRPHLEVNSVLELECRQFLSLGLRTLLLDLDCTLKDYYATTLNSEVSAWLRSLQEAGIQLCLLSNGKKSRIESLAQRHGLACVSRAFKPLPFGCWKAIRQLSAEARHTAVIGDQLFADVMAGRFAGLFTILVRPTTTLEPWFTRLKRPLERRVLAAMRARNSIPNVPVVSDSANSGEFSSACQSACVSPSGEAAINSTWRADL